MADKIVTITEPIANDIQAITILYDGAGVPLSVEVSCVITADDSETTHSTNASTLPTDYSAAAQSEMAAMAVTAAAKVSQLKNFPV